MELALISCWKNEWRSRVKSFPIKTVLATSIASIVASTASAELIISQYVEGSSYNKAIEIYNSGSETLNLSDYKLVKYSNGDQESPNDITLDSVSLSSGEVFVIASSSAGEALTSLANQTASSINFNGDDPVAIVRISDAETIDFFGQYGDIDFAKDATYSRTDNTAISQGTWNSDAWAVSAKDDYDGIGEAPNGGGTDEPDEPAFSCTGLSLTPTYAIQGSGDSSPLIPEGSYSIEGISTSGIVTDIVTSLYSGFFIQDAMGDGDAATSDAVFVYASNTPAGLAVGDEVCIQGEVTEYYSSTQISMDTDAYEILSSGNELNATELTFDAQSLLHDQLEAYEGMFVTTSNSDLIVSRNFSFDYDSYRNNMVMSYQEPIYKSTHLYVAGTEEEVTLAADNAKNTLYIDTDAKPGNGVVPYFPDFNAEDGYIRVGDEVTNLEGVIAYSYSHYRLIARDDVVLEKSDFTRELESDRTSYGPILAADGNLRVASFNVLNLFNSPFGGDANAHGDNRGAEEVTEYQLQLTKIANAISMIDADIVGLMEIENNGFGENSAIAALVNQINNTQSASALPYSYVSAGDDVGTDAIAVGLIYRADAVTLVDDAVKIDMPEQHGVDSEGTAFDKYMRVSLLQKFKHIESKRKLSIVVNHLKSKGSSCIEDTANEDDAQGSCNAFRVSAAVTLGEYLDENVKGDILVIGDLNAYGKEDPVRVLTDYDAENADRKIMTVEQATLNGEALNAGVAIEVSKSYGFTNLVAHFQGDKAHSYTYSGELGSLDHALANKSLLRKIVATDDWHINSAESSLFEYSSGYTGDLAKSENAYSSSDHDPVIIEIEYNKRGNHGEGPRHESPFEFILNIFKRIFSFFWR
jgi:predicted extracellular nuclease